MEFLAPFARYLTDNRLKLATAESCTAGLIASMLGDYEGSGAWLECGFITYSPEAKHALLGVLPATIRQHGLTSVQVATEMAEGALKRSSNSDISIANTGVAGPDAAPDGTPAGTVCLAWSFRNGGMQTYTEMRRFSGDRNTVRKSAARYAIERALFYHRLSQQERGIP